MPGIIKAHSLITIHKMYVILNYFVYLLIMKHYVKIANWKWYYFNTLTNKQNDYT